jgi:hypothetical protein
MNRRLPCDQLDSGNIVAAMHNVHLPTLFARLDYSIASKMEHDHSRDKVGTSPVGARPSIK